MTYSLMFVFTLLGKFIIDKLLVLKFLGVEVGHIVRVWGTDEVCFCWLRSLLILIVVM